MEELNEEFWEECLPRFKQQIINQDLCIWLIDPLSETYLAKYKQRTMTPIYTTGTIPTPSSYSIREKIWSPKRSVNRDYKLNQLCDANKITVDHPEIDKILKSWLDAKWN